MQDARRLGLAATTVLFVLINFVMDPEALAQASGTQLTSLQQLTQALVTLSEAGGSILSGRPREAAP